MKKKRTNPYKVYIPAHSTLIFELQLVKMER